ncbi:MYND-type domain-containing protein [Mycena chlorophos]|uniref:MYND-type domain-containing protein n=1 Tax=Mycena chlorophos TaxID=658473 RepID=A0A8H6S6I8_MYCCL|nr:MYND-type domain-containing protein [Mycena chlorophos]
MSSSNATAAAAAAAAAAEFQAAILAAFNPNPTIGALLVGTLCSYVLLGISTVQAYLYYSRFPDDPRGLKFLVAFVWIIEMAHSGVIGNALYTFAVTDYGNPLSLLAKPPISLGLSIGLSALINAIVQAFFAYRIWIMAPNRIIRLIPIALWLSLLVYFIAALADTVLAIKAPNIQQFTAQYGWLLLGPWVMNLIMDNTITVSLVLLLLNSRARTGFLGTTTLIDQLIKWTIETGMLTSIFSILNLVLYQTEKNTFIWIAIQFVKARMFANSLFASLNSRVALRALSATTGHSISGRGFAGTETQQGQTVSVGPGSHGRGPASPINIAMTKVSFRDHEGSDEIDRDERRSPIGYKSG